MAFRPTPLTKLIVVTLIAGAAAYGIKYASSNGIFDKIAPARKTVASTVLEQKTLPPLEQGPAGQVQSASVPVLYLPSSNSNPASSGSGPTIKVKFWAWNAQLGWIFANGGKTTTRDSLMAKHGVNMTIAREDDTNVLRDLLFDCAKEMHDTGRDDCTNVDSKGNPTGIHFTALMGDQLGAQFASWNDELFGKLGPEYRIENIASAGRSAGEDSFLAHPKVKLNAQNARGIVVINALREGDQNIVISWAANNKIPLNPDERTYDPDAINFMAAPSYTKAAEMYNTNPCNNEKRPVVSGGKRTGASVNLCDSEFVDKFGLATWTPGDVTATVSKTARGNLVRIWSTKENSSQMPNAIIGIKKWNAAHSDTVEAMLAAIFDGGDQVKYHPEALKKGAELSWEVYNREESPDYWYKYFLGVEEIDKQGNKVQLGGSAVFNLADNIRFYGLMPGQANLFKNTYELFGGYMHQLYPKEVPRIQPYAEAVNTSYLERLARRAPATTTASVREYRANEGIGEVTGRRDWSIEFDSGKATFTQSALRTLEELRSNLLANEVPFEIHGHTDSTGTPDGNQTLSEQRAFAVKQYLQEHSPGNFPETRMHVYAHGQTQPLVPNTSPANMAKNRRVAIVLGR